MKHRILIVDDDASLRKVMAFQLSEAGFQVLEAAGGPEAMETLQRQEVDVVLTDLKMPTVSGIELLSWVKQRYPRTQVVVITAYGTVDDAVQAMKQGAFDFVTKPLNREHLKVTVEKAAEHASLVDRVSRLEKEVDERYGRKAFVHVSESMAKVLDLAEKVAASDATTLITGESGTGKELIARMIHYNSERRSNPLVTINCAAIPRDLLESELFGHARGAFTGAIKDKRGKFESADGGSLFLDEIGEMPFELQAKLLRVLETNEVDIIGREKPLAVDVRIIAATNRNLKTLVSEGKFRDDLYFRINVIRIHIPPLRERREDIPPLTAHFLRELAKGDPIEVEPEVFAELQRRPWPGNVRELRNTCERMVLMRSGNQIRVSDIPPEESHERSDMPPVTIPAGGYPMAELERESIRQALAHAGGNKSKAARLLDIPRHVLVYRMRKLSMT